MTDLTVSFSPAARPRALPEDAARDCSVALRLCDSGAGALSRPAPAAAPAGIAGEMARARASSPPVASPDFSRFTRYSLSGCGALAAWRVSAISPSPRSGRNERDVRSRGERRSTGLTKSLPIAPQVRSNGCPQGDSPHGATWAISQTSRRWPSVGGRVKAGDTGSRSLQIRRGVDVERDALVVVHASRRDVGTELTHAEAVCVVDLPETSAQGGHPPGGAEPVRAALRSDRDGQVRRLQRVEQPLEMGRGHEGQ